VLLCIIILASVSAFIPSSPAQTVLVLAVLGGFAFFSVLIQVTWLPIEMFAILAVLGLMNEWRPS